MSEAQAKFGRSEGGYGVWLWLGPRIRWSSNKAWTAKWRLMRGGDEHCNDTVSVRCWPFGGISVWWRWHQRTEADGICDACQADMRGLSTAPVRSPEWLAGYEVGYNLGYESARDGARDLAAHLAGAVEATLDETKYRSECGSYEWHQEHPESPPAFPHYPNEGWAWCDGCSAASSADATMRAIFAAVRAALVWRESGEPCDASS